MTIKEKSDIEFPDTPVFIRLGETRHRPLRVRPKPRKIVDMGIQQLNKRQRQTLKNIISNPKEPVQGARDAGYSKDYAPIVVDKLMRRKPIIQALEKAGGTDQKVAEVLVEGLESEHPFRPGIKDPQAILGFAKEINKVKDNYPPTRIESKSQSQVMVVHFSAENVKQHEKYKKMRGVDDRDR